MRQWARRLFNRPPTASQVEDNSFFMGTPELFNLGDLIRRELDPKKISLIDLGGEITPRQFSYEDIDLQSNAVARGLDRLNFPKGSKVAILSANRAEFLFSYFGIMRAGYVAVPINHKFPKSMIEFVLQDSDSVMVFCDKSRAELVPAKFPTIIFDKSGKDGFNDFINLGDFKVIHPKPEELAMLLYTSGSTGKPKGVMLSHSSHLWVARTRLGKNDWSHHRFLIAAPLYHMNALALAKLSIYAHASMVLLPQFDAKNYLSAINEYACTWLTAVPPMIAMMLQETELVKKTNFSSVEYIRMGSAPVSKTLLESIQIVLPKAKISNAFGTTEGSPVAFGPHPLGITTPPMSVGCSHHAVKLRLVDGNNKDANRGELELKSEGLMTGYYKANFRVPPLKNPFTDDGYYRTGDIFERDEDGFYYFVGRIDDMFVSGGENIYPGEVEKLLESHPCVQQAAVIPVEDAIKGQKPAAFVVLKENTLCSAETLKQYCLDNAPAYQHPRWIWLVENLPLASTNKIDKVELMSEARNRIMPAT